MIVYCVGDVVCSSCFDVLPCLVCHTQWLYNVGLPTTYRNKDKMAKIFPYSYSSLTGFETCARKYYEERILKSTIRTESPAAAAGTALHLQAETFIQDGKPFEHKYAVEIMKVVTDLKSKNTQVIPEAEIAVTKDLKPTTFWADDCYARGKIDVLTIGEEEAEIIDWKTGKADVFSTQLKHNAVLVMANYPHIKRVRTRYEWLKEGYATKAVVHREFLKADWAKFEGRAAKLEKAFTTNMWPEKKSGLCKNYCDVHNCSHNGHFKT